MILLASECLLFELADGQGVPYSAEAVPAELLGEVAQEFDRDFVIHAAKAVFHFFKYDKAQQRVTAGEFSAALEKVLRKFGPGVRRTSLPGVLDLASLARDCGEGCELFFFPALRDELRRQVRSGPRVLRFHGLRGCVKRLARSRRWTSRCRNLREQIVSFLRECLRAEAGQSQVALVVE